MYKNVNSDILLVSTLEDENDGDFGAGDLSLREAITLANEQEGVDTISFKSGLNGSIILTEGELSIEDSVAIFGLGADNLTIDGNNSSRVFKIDDGNSETDIDVNIRGLTIANGLVNDPASVAETENLGGGIFNQENLTITGSNITNNSTSGSFNSSGGGIYTSGTLNLTDSEVIGNTAVLGGGIHSSSGIVNLTNSNISGNSVGFVGGGLFYQDTEITVTNSTIANNEAAKSSGGIFLSNSTGNISNSTITNNSATVDGAGIGSGNTEGGIVNLESTIVAGNANNEDLAGNQINSNGNNLIGNGDGVDSFNSSQGDLVGTAENPIDPGLGNLDDNGGITATIALLDGSPAINAGGNPNGLTTDQRGVGFDRTIGDGTDIGAFELQTISSETSIIETPGMDNNLDSEIQTFIVSTLEDENDGDFSAGDLSLREAIALANDQEGTNPITFLSRLNGSIILTEGELNIEDSVIIFGLGADNLTIDANNSSRVFNIDDGNSETDIDVTIRGLTIANGLVADEVGENLGGGILNQENLTISNSVVTNNNTESNGGINTAKGGGIYTTGTLNLISSEVSGNSSDTFGGGIDSLETTVNIIDSSINNNFSGFVGGGLHNIDTELNITNSSITGNVANFSLGGIDLNDSTANISDSTISDNVAENASTGGIGINNSDVNISNSTVSGNSSQGDAGGISVVNSSTANITNSTLVNNSATGNGGGIDIGTMATANITNTTISGNSATGGAGIDQTPGFVVGTPDGDLTIEGGIVNLESTIVAGNIGNDLGGEQINSNGNNLIGNGDGVEVFNSLSEDLVGTAANPIDPLLGELADNGGATATIALLDSSPAINAGSNPNGLGTDQRGAGFDRTIGDGTDIGAFELQTISSDTSIIGTAGDDFLSGTEESDTIQGLDGNDTLNGLDEGDLLLGGNGDDSLDGGARNDGLEGGAGEDTLLGGNGRDFLGGGSDNDLLQAGASDDLLFGQDGDDTLFGDTGRDTLNGGFGNDSLNGGTSDDLLLGFEGEDTLDGGNGRDTLDGGVGNDLLTGGNSNDTFVLSSEAGIDTITDFGRGNNVIGLSDGITFADLSFVGNDIILGTQTLATLNTFDATTLTESDFVII